MFHPNLNISLKNNFKKALLLFRKNKKSYNENLVKQYNNYRNTRPTTYAIFGEDKTLLASLIIQIDCTNALLHFLNDNYPNKVSKTNLVIDKVLNLDNDIDIISNSPMDNIDIYKKKTLDLFNGE